MVETNGRPDAVVIGGMKAGTTTLHRLLAMSVHCRMLPKESGVLRRYSGEAAGSAYRTLTVEGSRGPIIDVSASYCADLAESERSARNASATLPRSTLILYLERERIDRAISHVLHEVRSGRLDLSGELPVADLDRIIDASDHERALAPWGERFDRVEVLRFEELVERPQDVVNAVAALLGVAANVAPSVHENAGGGRKAVDHRIGKLLSHPRAVAVRQRTPSQVKMYLASLLLRDRTEGVSREEVRTLVERRVLYRERNVR